MAMDCLMGRIKSICEQNLDIINKSTDIKDSSVSLDDSVAEILLSQVDMTLSQEAQEQAINEQSDVLAELLLNSLSV